MIINVKKEKSDTVTYYKQTMHATFQYRDVHVNEDTNRKYDGIKRTQPHTI